MVRHSFVAIVHGAHKKKILKEQKEQTEPQEIWVCSRCNMQLKKVLLLYRLPDKYVCRCHFCGKYVCLERAK